MNSANDPNDEYDGIFNEATIEDFILETTATHHEPRSTTDFDTFVTDNHRGLRRAYVASETNYQPIAVLVNADSEHIFTPDDEESLGEWMARLNREAKRLDAIWTFVAKKTLVGSDPAEKLHDANDPEYVEDAIARGILGVGVLWYAEEILADGSHRHRSGIMRETSGRLDASIESPSNQPVPIFNTILA